jgi:chloramphenicol-sensitive protein RarD
MTNTSTNDPSGAVRDGLVFGVIAYTLWGLFPIYLKAVGDASALEILAHRILWSVPFGAVLIALRKQWGEVKTALATPRVLGLLAISALAISFNWLIYVWAVINDHVLEASLGYYINPLMYVATGVFILGERLRLAQIIAVCLATIGVLVLTLGAGVFPWVSLVLAVLFTLYGFLRKTTPVGAMPGLFVETTLLSPIALVYLVWLMTSGGAVFLTKSTSMDTLLVLAGPVTVVPLVLFALSARRLRLSTIGFLQYIGPTLQLALGLYYGETFTWAHGVCFGLIWTALAIFSIDAARANRVERLMKAA